jgi:D-amino acid aminotransferase
MSRTVYLNGEWLAEEDAKISVFDRGFTFADAIYEVTAVLEGRLIEYAGHVARLKRSLSALQIKIDLSDDEMLAVHREIVTRNGIENGLIYLQISRGAEDRDFTFSRDLKPTIVLYTQEKDILSQPKWKTGLKLVSHPEGRWSNRQIKTVQLLYSSLAKMNAVENGADDVLFVEDGFVTESSGSNFHIVTKDGTLVTRDLSNALLHGITRGSLLDIARDAGFKVEERSFTLEEVFAASEAFITAATAFVSPVVELDGRAIGTGMPGPMVEKLRDLYIADRRVNAI